MNFDQKMLGSDRWTNQLQISVLLGIPCSLRVVCRSESRNGTSFEIFDQHKESMGRETFFCDMGPISGSFNHHLVENLNILFEEFGVQIDKKDFMPISNLAVNKCESRYGKGTYDGDCIIILN